MTLLEMKAVRALPAEYIVDGTHICTVSTCDNGSAAPDGGIVIAMNTSLQPLHYWKEAWQPFNVEAFVATK